MTQLWSSDPECTQKSGAYPSATSAKSPQKPIWSLAFITESLFWRFYSFWLIQAAGWCSELLFGASPAPTLEQGSYILFWQIGQEGNDPVTVRNELWPVNLTVCQTTLVACCESMYTCMCTFDKQSVSHVLGTLPGTLYILPYLTFITSLWSRSYYFPHFNMRESISITEVCSLGKWSVRTFMVYYLPVFYCLEAMVGLCLPSCTDFLSSVADYSMVVE